MEIIMKIVTVYQSMKKGTDDVHTVIADICLIGNCINCIGDFHHSYHQITDYDWVDSVYVRECARRLSKVLELLKIKKRSFEQTLHQNVKMSCDFCDKQLGVQINGRMDIKSPRFSVEVKAKIALEESDFLQAGTYAAITNQSCYLANIKTGEIYLIRAGPEFDVTKALEHKHDATVTETLAHTSLPSEIIIETSSEQSGDPPEDGASMGVCLL